MSFLDGVRYEPTERWIAFLHFHLGVRALLDYQAGTASREAALKLLDEAIAHFDRATQLHPAHAASRHDFLLASLERASYAPPDEGADAVARLLPSIRTFSTEQAASDPGASRLLLAAYVLLAEAQSAARQYADAVPNYQAALTLADAPGALAGYLLNNRMLGQCFSPTSSRA
jgi:tetratricopeptide (TPR) repeat protein